MENKSGIQPIEYKVLVIPDIVTDETLGGIVRPDRVKEIASRGRAEVAKLKWDETVRELLDIFCELGAQARW